MTYTFYNPKYEMINVMRPVQVSDTVYYVNVFDPRIIEMMLGITEWRAYTHDSTVPLTTVSYRYYNTTTLDWVILTYNGGIHEFEIEDGALLRIPSLASVGQVFAQARSPSRIGQSTSI